MKVAFSIFGVLFIIGLMLFGILFIVGQYHLSNEISAQQYANVVELNKYASYDVDKAMEDGVITNREYYKIVDEAKTRLLILAKIKIVTDNPTTKEKGKMIRLESSEGLLND